MKGPDKWTAEDIPELDQKHEAIGLGEQWLKSARRAEILNRGGETEEIEPSDVFMKLVQGLWDQLSREPTANEVYKFIYGTDEDRTSIWGSVDKAEGK